MSYIQENIWLLSNFCMTDSKTVMSMKADVLPWAKARLEDCKQLAQLVDTPLFSKDIDEEIILLTNGIELCEQRLTTLEG